MEEKKVPSTVEKRFFKERDLLDLLDWSNFKVKLGGSIVLPGNISRILGEHFSGSDEEYPEDTPLGVQPATLLFSQIVDSSRDSSWSMTVLPLELQSDPLDVKVDNRFPIKNFKSCLEIPDQNSPSFCRAVIKALVVQLVLFKRDPQSTMNELQSTICALQSHLGNVEYVVISTARDYLWCFNIKDKIEAAPTVRPSVNHSTPLLQIFNDLNTCWNINHTPSAHDLLFFYFKSKVKRASEMYLEKFVISSELEKSRALDHAGAFGLVSNKIVYARRGKSYADLAYFAENSQNPWQSIVLDASVQTQSKVDFLIGQLPYLMPHLLTLPNCHSIQRIIIHAGTYRGLIRLPWPMTTPFTNMGPLSALTELTLKGLEKTFDLTQINRGAFPHLQRLTLIGGHIQGHLDSHAVPRLQKLILEPATHKDQHNNDICSHLRKRVSSIIRNGRPWQVITSRESGGWSLASYDEPISNPQNEEKKEEEENSSPSLPLIRELLLIMNTEEHASEWLSKLNNSHSSLDAEDHTDGLLVWAPQCVQKISAFGLDLVNRIPFSFEDVKPSQTRILDTLSCRNLNLTVNGAVMPHVRSLKMCSSWMTLSGTFPCLQTLLLIQCRVEAPWYVDAPALQSLSCRESQYCSRLSLNPPSLPCLSSLRVIKWERDIEGCPDILFDRDGRGFPCLQHIEFSSHPAQFSFFDRCQMDQVSHVCLRVDPHHLPACWFNTAWQCEHFELDVHMPRSVLQAEMEVTALVLPRLPRVKTLTILAENADVLLNTEMPCLTECTVPSPSSLGAKFKCPALKRIRFTEKLSKSERKKCTSSTMYFAIGAQPEQVIIASEYLIYTRSRYARLRETSGLSTDWSAGTYRNLAVVGSIFCVLLAKLIFS